MTATLTTHLDARLAPLTPAQRHAAALDLHARCELLNRTRETSADAWLAAVDAAVEWAVSE